MYFENIQLHGAREKDKWADPSEREDLEIKLGGNVQPESTGLWGPCWCCWLLFGNSCPLSHQIFLMIALSCWHFSFVLTIFQYYTCWNQIAMILSTPYVPSSLPGVIPGVEPGVGPEHSKVWHQKTKTKQKVKPNCNFFKKSSPIFFY